MSNVWCQTSSLQSEINISLWGIRGKSKLIISIIKLRAKCLALTMVSSWRKNFSLKEVVGAKCDLKKFNKHSKMFQHPLIVTPGFKTKTRCSSYVCPGSSCHTYGQNVSIEYQCLYYIVSYYRNLLQVQKGLNSGMNPILPQAVDRGFRMPRRSLHQRTHLLSSRAKQQYTKNMTSMSTYSTQQV
jgi:hypothetical protein